MAFHKSDAYLEEIIATLKKEFRPQKLYLFGSRATGTARENSDYDFVLVVRETEKSRVEDLIRAKELLRPLPVSADVFVYSEEEFEEWRNEFNSIPEVALWEWRSILPIFPRFGPHPILLGEG